MKDQTIIKSSQIKENLKQLSYKFRSRLTNLWNHSRDAYKYAKDILELMDQGFYSKLGTEVPSRLLTKLHECARIANDLKQYGEAWDYHACFVGEEYKFVALEKLEEAAFAEYNAAIDLTNSILRQWDDTKLEEVCDAPTNDRTFYDNLEDMPLVE